MADLTGGGSLCHVKFYVYIDVAELFRDISFFLWRREEKRSGRGHIFGREI